MGVGVMFLDLALMDDDLGWPRINAEPRGSSRVVSAKFRGLLVKGHVAGRGSILST